MIPFMQNLFLPQVNYGSPEYWVKSFSCYAIIAETDKPEKLPEEERNIKIAVQLVVEVSEKENRNNKRNQIWGDLVARFWSMFHKSSAMYCVLLWLRKTY